MAKLTDLELTSKRGCNFCDARDLLKEYVYSLSLAAFQQGDTARDAIRTPEERTQRQNYVREKFIEGIGGLPSMETPLNPVVTEVLAFEGYRVEKIRYESRPQVYVTANLYIPEGISAPSAAVMFVCGHFAQGKHAEEYQIVCQYLVRAGLIVLAQDPVGQGERYSYWEPSLGQAVIRCCTEEHDYVGFQSLALGQSLARYFVHDAMRSIDYLCTRPEVDPQRIGITGNSGGGTQSSMMMLADPRLAAAVPATFIMNREIYMRSGQAQDREQIWPGLTEWGIDHEDIIGNMAPKPVLMLGVAHDFFPLEATERTFRRCERLWEMSGQEDALQLFVDDSDHHYTPAMARKAAAFFAKHLLGKETVDIDEKLICPVEQKKLWVTQSGQLRGELADARFVHEELQDCLRAVQAQREARPAPERKQETIAFLREKVYKNRHPYPLYIKKQIPHTQLLESVEDLVCNSFLWYTQDRMLNQGYLFRSLARKDERLPVTICLWEGGTSALQVHYEEIHDICAGGRGALVLDLCGMGMMAQRSVQGWTDPLSFYGVMFKLNDDLLWLNDSLAALRTYDLLRALDMLRENPYADGGTVELYSIGRYSLYADLAGLLDKRIGKTTAEKPLVSYGKFITDRYYNTQDIAGVILPGLLRYADLDEIRKWNLET